MKVSVPPPLQGSRLHLKRRPLEQVGLICIAGFLSYLLFRELSGHPAAMLRDPILWILIALSPTFYLAAILAPFGSPRIEIDIRGVKVRHWRVFDWAEFEGYFFAERGPVLNKEGFLVLCLSESALLSTTGPIQTLFRWVSPVSKRSRQISIGERGFDISLAILEKVVRENSALAGHPLSDLSR